VTKPVAAAGSPHRSPMALLRPVGTGAVPLNPRHSAICLRHRNGLADDLGLYD
jgi:hypothetical protein